MEGVDVGLTSFQTQYTLVHSNPSTDSFAVSWSMYLVKYMSKHLITYQRSRTPLHADTLKRITTPALWRNQKF